MLVSQRPHLKALVPGSVFDGADASQLEAVFHADTGVLNVLTPGAPYQGAGTVPCPLYDGIADLPTWAHEVLASAPAQMDRLELLQRIIATTHAALDEIEELRNPAAGESNCASPGQAGAEAPARTQEDAHPCAPGGESAQGAQQPDKPAEHFCLLREAGSVRALCDLGEFEVERYDLVRNVFSRNTGILETDVMAGKRAIILGCGSVGSLVAVELARAGVGGFLLVDMDLVEYHNVCRHRCGISDVGRRKPDAVADLVRNINPVAHVETCYTEIQQVPRDLLASWCSHGETIVFGCADNRNVDVYANDFAADFGAAFVSIGFWERAFAGEVFYWIPGQGHACYRCALTGDAGLSQRIEANHHIYTSQTDLAQVNFEPGIAVDIDFVTLVGVKLGLDIFNAGDVRFTPRLLPHLTQYTLVCNTNDPTVGGVMAEIFSYPLQVTTSLQVHRGPSCPVCGTRG